MFFAVGEGGGVGNEVVVIVTSSVFPEHPARGCPLDLGTLNCALGRSRSHISRGVGCRATEKTFKRQPHARRGVDVVAEKSLCLALICIYVVRIRRNTYAIE